MTISEKKLEKIAELKKQGYSTGKIAKEVGVSWDTVRNNLEQAGNEDNMNEKKTISGETSSKMFKMFSEGKTPVEAVIELSITPEEAEQNYDMFKKLQSDSILSSQQVSTIFYVCGGLKRIYCGHFDFDINSCLLNWDELSSWKEFKFKIVNDKSYLCPTDHFCVMCPFFKSVYKDEKKR